ncbi:MAG: xanthine dehydrogenase family protein molybdopterin-binding subunit [Thalassobaculum sp.]
MYRFEDARLLTGGGRYVEDVRPEDALAMRVLRSPVAHGAITSLDLEEARDLPGVVAILTAKDLVDLGIGPMTALSPVANSDGSPMVEPPRPVLAEGEVKYVGQPIVAVIAESDSAAENALEAIGLDIDERANVTDPEAAFGGTVEIWPDAPQNVAIDWDKGNREETEAAFAEAAHVVELTVRHPRVAIQPIETRGCIGTYEIEADHYTLVTPSQGVMSLKGAMARYLGVDADRVRVITEDVGGSFAVKIWPYPEQVLVLAAARVTGRPVAWQASRTESFISDAMGRGRVDRAALALDDEGRFLGFRIDALADIGAYWNAVNPSIVTGGAVRTFGHCYRIPGMHYRVRGVFTNAMTTDAYRGAGKPESGGTLERLIDVAADRLGIDRMELRRRNLITPDLLPYTTAMGETIDGGDFPKVFARIQEISEAAGIGRRKSDSERAGKLRGFAIGTHMHATGGSVAERSEVRALPDGSVVVRTGTQDSGQGHRTALAMVAAEVLEIPVERIRVEQGDSDFLTKGGGTGGSNLMPIAANTVHRTARHMLDKAKQVAGHLLEAAPVDIEYGLGAFRIAGTDRRISLGDVAAGWDSVPPEQYDGDLGTGCMAQLDFEGVHTTFPNGAYAVEVEVDPETGHVRLARFSGVDDLGRVINEQTARGQLHGGIGQAVGEALMEVMVHDPDSGQVLSGSLMDYALPRAGDMPMFDLHWAPTASPNSLIGAKGVGEVSSIGAPGVIVNAVLDALRPFGVEHIDLPLTPEKVWRAMHASRD